MTIACLWEGFGACAQDRELHSRIEENVRHGRLGVANTRKITLTRLLGATLLYSRAVPHDESGPSATKHPIIRTKQWLAFDASWNSAYRLKPIIRYLKFRHGSSSSSAAQLRRRNGWLGQSCIETALFVRCPDCHGRQPSKVETNAPASCRK